MGQKEIVLHPADKFIVSVISAYYLKRDFDGADADICWEDVLARVARHRIGPLLYFAIKNDPKIGVPEWVAEVLKESFFESVFKQAYYQEGLEQILTYLEDKGIEIIVMKGFVLSRLIYPDPALRTFVDLDLLFKEQDWSEIRKALLEAGFTPTTGFESLPPKIIDGEVFEHILAFYNETGSKIELKLDPFDLGIRSRMIGEIWDKSVVYDFGSIKCRALSPEHQLLHLLLHLNQHGFKRMKWFIDIAFILASDQALDWELIANAARREGVLAPAYFTLINVCKLFDIELSEEILNRLRPGPLRRMLWQSIWPEEHIAGFSGTEYAAFLFPKKVFSKWFIPNILLTGKAVQKSSYFIRRVFPTGDFLERKYSNGEKRSYAYYMAKRFGSLFKFSDKAKPRV